MDTRDQKEIVFVVGIDNSTEPPKSFTFHQGTEGVVKIGRANDNDVVIPIRGVSSYHVELRPRQTGDNNEVLFVRDVSMNGTGLKCPGAEIVLLKKNVDTPLPDGAVLRVPMRVKSDCQEKYSIRVQIQKRPSGLDPPGADHVKQTAPLLASPAVGINTVSPGALDGQQQPLLTQSFKQQPSTAKDVHHEEHKLLTSAPGQTSIKNVQDLSTQSVPELWQQLSIPSIKPALLEHRTGPESRLWQTNQSVEQPFYPGSMKPVPVELEAFTAIGTSVSPPHPSVSSTVPASVVSAVKTPDIHQAQFMSIRAPPVEQTAKAPPQPVQSNMNPAIWPPPGPWYTPPVDAWALNQTKAVGASTTVMPEAKPLSVQQPHILASTPKLGGASVGNAAQPCFLNRGNAADPLGQMHPANKAGSVIGGFAGVVNPKNASSTTPPMPGTNVFPNNRSSMVGELEGLWNSDSVTSNSLPEHQARDGKNSGIGLHSVEPSRPKTSWTPNSWKMQTGNSMDQTYFEGKTADKDSSGFQHGSADSVKQIFQFPYHHARPSEPFEGGTCALAVTATTSKCPPRQPPPEKLAVDPFNTNKAPPTPALARHPAPPPPPRRSSDTEPSRRSRGRSRSRSRKKHREYSEEKPYRESGRYGTSDPKRIKTSPDRHHSGYSHGNGAHTSHGSSKVSSLHGGDDGEPSGQQNLRINSRGDELQPVEDAAEHYRSKIRNIYKRFNPEKLTEIDRIFNKYLGAEQKLYEALCQKYL